jgi:hypothetical protein
MGMEGLFSAIGGLFSEAGAAAGDASASGTDTSTGSSSNAGGLMGLLGGMFGGSGDDKPAANTSGGDTAAATSKKNEADASKPKAPTPTQASPDQQKQIVDMIKKAMAQQKMQTPHTVAPANIQFAPPPAPQIFPRQVI